ncbi:MAG: TrkH family potassium uptake protein [Deltaproteobacteria bacterium]|nr:TrkH family potassium uptake protein [Deltaproteobacteria bacterium]
MARFLAPKRSRFITPVNLPLLSFAGLILVGTVLLMLPHAANGPRLTPVDALFTATSATCVTGLVVVDTGSRLSLFGQWVVLILIQCGGLGIMTFSTVLILLMTGRFSFIQRSVIQDTFTHSPDTRLPSLVLHVVVFTLVLEAAGAAMLFLRFSEMYHPGRALYMAIFHAISAYCNAGFGLYSQSLMDFSSDPLVSLTVALLIICGGIGFLVVLELKSILFRSHKARRARRISVHSKLVLTITALLLIVGTMGFLALEWNQSMARLSLPAKVLAAFFQSVTTRTAGFNTLDFGKMANVTLLFTILLMFIGAASGSTGGGIKVNTLGVLFALSRSRLRGEESTSIFRRTLTAETVGRAISVFVVAVIVIYVATMALTVSELGTTIHGESRGLFLELLFEVVSAFGTVGLSVGITSKLSTLGKLILVVVMYIGRLGPLSIAVALSGREPRSKIQYAEENVMIG